MGKQYYCDYCDRNFADGAENRKKHLISLQHQKLRKAHYDVFRDAATILKEELQKKPCRNFSEIGHCEYGSGCKYSHLTAMDIYNLQEQAKADETEITTQSDACSEVPEVNVKEWLDNVMKKKRKKDPQNPSLNIISTPSVPEILKNIPNLPPSLIPSVPLDILQEDITTWSK